LKATWKDGQANHRRSIAWAEAFGKSLAPFFSGRNDVTDFFCYYFYYLYQLEVFVSLVFGGEFFMPIF
jgi:hypothetical protein